MLTLLLTCFLMVANCGHIYPHDLIINPNNVNSTTELTLIFTLDTSIASTDYLRVILPFTVNSLQPSYWDTYINCSTEGTSKRAITTPSNISDDTNAYFVQFYTDLTATTLSSLSANTTYFLKIRGTIDPSATVGIYSPVQVSSVSNNLANWITYDSNPIFGTLTLTKAYPTTMTVTVTTPDTEVSKNVLGGSYKVEVDIQPLVTVNNDARIDIALTNPQFSLLSCKSVTTGAQSSIALATVFQPLTSNIMRAVLPKTLSAANSATYRVECVVRNPVTPAVTQMNVTTRMRYIETIMEAGIYNGNISVVPTAIETSLWDDSKHSVLLGWGYQASAASAIPIYSLYKDASPTEVWYQSVTTNFQPQADMVSMDKLQLSVSTVNDTNFIVLAASIHHNLPDFSPKDKVSCSVQQAGTLTCINVGQLQAQTYFVSFRFNIPSTVSATSATDFGKVTLLAQAGGAVVIPLSATTLTNTVINNNVALFTTAGSGIIASSTTVASSTAAPYVTNGEAVILKFSFKYFTTSVIPLNTSEIDYGIEFYTSQALASSTTPTCTINTLVQTTDVVLTDCGVEQSDQYTRLRFRLAQFGNIAAGSNAAKLFQATPQDGSILFNSVTFAANQFSSLNYVNENVFDYYVRWVQNFQASNPTVTIAAKSSPFFFNSLVYNAGSLANVQVGSSLFVTAAAAGGSANTGADFPSLIRITGYLAPTEQESADRLLVFFNDLTPLDTNNPCFGPTGIVCKYQVNGHDNTQTDSLTDYSGSRRVEIDMDLTQGFNIYIPVTTTAGKTSIGFFVTTASSVDTQSDSQGIFATQYSKRVNQFTSTATALAIQAAGTSTPKITIPTNTSIGATINTTINNLATAFQVTTPNSGAAVGAAYGYCANYDFTSQAGFTLQPFYANSSTPEELCVNIQYTSTATQQQVSCQICPVDSAMTGTSINATNFKMPSMTGQDFLNLTYVVGTNNGNFQAAVKDEQTTVLTPYNLTALSLTFAPENIRTRSKNVYATLSFTLTSALPQTIRLKITPTGNSSSLYMIPVTGIDCQVGTLSVSNCSVSGSTTGLQIDAVAEDSAWSALTHNITFMVDADATAAALTADTPITFNLAILVSGLTPSTAIMYNSVSQQFLMVSAPLNSIQLSNVTYLFMNQGARSVISIPFTIPSDMILYSQQKIVFKLDDIANANSGETPSCVVLDAATNQVSNIFGNCLASDLTQLTLQPKVSASGSFIIQLGFIGTPTSSATGVSAQITGVDGNTAVATTEASATVLLPTPSTSTLIPGGNAVISRLYSDPGSVSQVTLTLIPSVNPILLSTNVYIYFPSYYSEKLGYKNIWCTANGLPTSCFIIASRLLRVTSFPQNTTVGESVTITIYGIMTPQVPTQPSNIFIGIADNEGTSTLTEQAEVSDIASASTSSSALFITNSSLTDIYMREKSNFTFSFTTDKVGLATGKVLAVDFPDQYGNILDGKAGPMVSILVSDGSLLAEVQSVAYGSQVQFTIPINLNPLTLYTFRVEQIDNPDYPVCKLDRPLISILDSTRTHAAYRTTSNIWDTAPIIYTANPDLQTLNWVTPSGQSIDTITLSMGMYSSEIWIVPPSGQNYKRDVTFIPSEEDLTYQPETLTAEQGASYLSFRIGAPITASPRVILLSLDKTEDSDSNVYSKLPRLKIILNNNPSTIPVGPIKIVRGGVSLPYLWDLSALNIAPQAELKIKATILGQANASISTIPILSALGPSTLVLTSSAPSGGITFELKDNVDAANPPSFNLSLGGQDMRNYQLNSTLVQIQVLEPNTTAPVLSGLSIKKGSGPTKRAFAFQVDQMTSVYWHVAYKSKLSTFDCLRIRQKYEEGFTFESTNANQDQYGVFYVYNENQTTTFEIGNLLTSQQYSYILCPINQLDSVGSSIIGVFETQDNQARLFEVIIGFSQSITRDQLTELVCLFSTELQLPNLK